MKRKLFDSLPVMQQEPIDFSQTEILYLLWFMKGVGQRHTDYGCVLLAISDHSAEGSPETLHYEIQSQCYF